MYVMNSEKKNVLRMDVDVDGCDKLKPRHGGNVLCGKEEEALRPHNTVKQCEDPVCDESFQG